MNFTYAGMLSQENHFWLTALIAGLQKSDWLYTVVRVLVDNIHTFAFDMHDKDDDDENNVV